MKGFIISLLMLTATVLLTVILSVYGYKASEKLLDTVEKAYSASAENRCEIIGELHSLWLEKRSLLSFSLHKSEIDNINVIVTSLSESANAENADLLCRNLCRQLTEAFEHIKELHTVSFEGIF